MQEKWWQKNYKKILIVHFLYCEAIFIPLFAILLIYHGPFVTLRNYIVSTAMGTNGNKGWAEWFLSRSEIQRILAQTNPQVKNGREIINGVTVANNVSSDSASSSGISISNISGATYKGKLMTIRDPSKITIGLAPKLGKTGAPLSEIVRTNKAIGGINAGGFLDDNFMGTGANPDGVVVQGGKLLFHQAGLTQFSVIGFSQNNILVVSNSMTTDEINKSNLRCAISFGPALILNGQPLVSKGGTSLQPRSAIGQRQDGTVLLLAIDGREHDSAGANYADVQNILLKYGAYNAANLDGGSSTTLNYRGVTVNTPCDITGERSIATAFLIMP